MLLPDNTVKQLGGIARLVASDTKAVADAVVHYGGYSPPGHVPTLSGAICHAPSPNIRPGNDKLGAALGALSHLITRFLPRQVAVIIAELSVLACEWGATVSTGLYWHGWEPSLVCVIFEQGGVDGEAQTLRDIAIAGTRKAGQCVGQAAKKESQKKWLSFAPKWGTHKGILLGLAYATCVLHKKRNQLQSLLGFCKSCADYMGWARGLQGMMNPPVASRAAPGRSAPFTFQPP